MVTRWEDWARHVCQPLPEHTDFAKVFTTVATPEALAMPFGEGGQ